MTGHELASSCVYDVWVQTEHAYRMAESARLRIGQADYSAALADIEVAEKAADKAVFFVREAVERLRELAKGGAV